MSHIQHRRGHGQAGRDRDQTSGVPLNIWPVAQASAQQQRAGRYPAENRAHPGKMLPELARRVVAECSLPGELVVDPMAGSGATLVEGAGLGRRCVGVELEPRWAGLAERNLDHVLTADQRDLAEVRRGDARQLPSVLGDLAGHGDLIVTSPPYASTIQQIDEAAWHAGGSLSGSGTHDYSADRADIGRGRGQAYEQAMADVYAGCFDVLRPGGALVTVTKNTHDHGKLLDLAGLTVTLAQQAGFIYMGHIVALHAAIHDGQLRAWPSSWQVPHRHRAARGAPLHLVVHDDVLVFTKPHQPHAHPHQGKEGDARV